MWTQIILIVALLGIAVYLLRSAPSARHLALRRLLVFGALVVGVIVIIAPGWLTTIAHALGVGRGTDLLLYAAIIVFLLYAVADYKRSLQVNRVQTQLARALTLTEARLHDELDADQRRSGA